MKSPASRFLLLPLSLSLAIPPLSAGEVIISDNFNAPDSSNFDNSVQTDRRGGMLADSIQLRSARAQQQILSNRLLMQKIAAGGSSRIRFHNTASLSTWWDFASGEAGAKILADGGLKVAFDWTPPDNTSANWVSFDIGFPPAAVLAEPATRVTNAETDFGFLFRDNGGTQYFDNGVSATGNAFDVSTVATRHVVITYAFTSFADGADVTATALVDGVTVADAIPFQWANNNGVLYMELGNYMTGTLIDNFSISTAADDGLAGKIDTTSFYSSVTGGGLVGTLSALYSDAPEPSTFTLVAGEGDTDNAKFKITGNRLESNGYDFTPLPDGATLSVRVRAVGTVPSRTVTFPLTLTIIADSDSDQIPDAWELLKAGNLTDLNGTANGPGPGAGTGNFDGDTLTDLQEYVIATGLSPHYPEIDPKLADTDGDGLEDGLEVNGDGTRPPTSPVQVDTDKDGLPDNIESNTGLLIGETDSGTNPAKGDSDGDFYPDNFEIERGSNPSDSSSLPVQETAFSFVPLSDDASTGISTAKTYTHAISGGYAVTINGVAFEVLNPTVTPANFTWAPTPATRSAIVVATPGDWLPATGGVTGPGLIDLLSGFVYSTSTPGSKQTFTLSGLTPDKEYDFRLYTRMWDTAGSGRPVDFLFTNGSTVSHALLPTDRPQKILPEGIVHSAYYLNYHYKAESDSLVIQTTVPLSAPASSGSLHLFGLTNEETSAVVPPAGDFVITSITYSSTPTPAVVITFPSTDGKTYAVDYATDLSAAGQAGGWTELVTAYPAGAGGSTSYTDTVIAGTRDRVFYRVRQLP